MTDRYSHESFPELDEMLHSLLLIEEGEHEFESEEEGAKELRHLFFPVTRHTIYLNHASSGPLPRPVAQTMRDYTDDVSNFGGMYSGRWDEYCNGAHRRLANMIGARPDQIALTGSTSDSLMLIAQGLDWREGDTILIAEGEFPSNVYPWLNLQEAGVRVESVPARNARIPSEDVIAHITERTRLVSLSLVEFSTGFRNDIKTIADYCHEQGIWCGIDASQALGALDIDVNRLNVDFLVGVSHKWLLSPRASGIFYASDALLETLHTRRKSWFSVEETFNFFDHQQPLKRGAARFEYSTPNSFPIVGLDAALGVFECIDGGMQAIEERILGLTAQALAGLEQLGYPIISPQGSGERSGILSVLPHPERDDLNAQQIVDELLARNIFVSARGNAIRISPHFYNTAEEIDALLNALEDLKWKPEPEQTQK